jgi:hypothetical protein
VASNFLLDAPIIGQPKSPLDLRLQGMETPPQQFVQNPSTMLCVNGHATVCPPRKNSNMIAECRADLAALSDFDPKQSSILHQSTVETRRIRAKLAITASGSVARAVERQILFVRRNLPIAKWGIRRTTNPISAVVGRPLNVGKMPGGRTTLPKRY